MKLSTHAVLRLGAVFALVPLILTGCEAAPPADDGAASMSSTLGGADLLANLGRTVGIAKDKFVDLAEAMPEELYGWRPMEGVRSVGDVFIHVAADNWYGPALMDIAAPPETGVTNEGTTVSAYQERDLSKARIVAELVASFDHLLAAMETTRDHLDEETMLGSNMVTYGDLWVRLATHMHEHLGQSIAYARANEVVPPWSM